MKYLKILPSTVQYTNVPVQLSSEYAEMVLYISRSHFYEKDVVK